MNVGTLTISLTARTASLAKAAAHVKAFEGGIVASVQRANAAISSVGMAFSALTIPIAAVGIGATKMFAEFEFSLAKVEGLVGIAHSQTMQWGKEILSLSKTIGRSANEMGEALYFTASAGIRGSNTMKIVETAANAAAAGMGESKENADLLTSAMNAYGEENLSVADSMDILVTAVREGKVEASDLILSMGKVLPISSAMSVSFNEVGAAIAALTRTGTPARTAGMMIRRMLLGLQKPAEGAKKALREMGGSFIELRDIAANEDGGLIKSLLKIKELTDLFGEEKMALVFPNLRSYLPALDLLGENLEKNKTIWEEMLTPTGNFNLLMETVSDTFQYKFNVAVNAAGEALIQLGHTFAQNLIPLIQEFAEKARQFSEWWTSLPRYVQNATIKITLFAGAIGPLLLLFSSLVGILIKVVSGLVGFVSVIFSPITLTLALAVAIALVVANLKDWKVVFNDIDTAIQKKSFEANLKRQQKIIEASSSILKRSMDGIIEYAKDDSMEKWFDSVTKGYEKVASSMAKYETAKTQAEREVIYSQVSQNLKQAEITQNAFLKSLKETGKISNLGYGKVRNQLTDMFDAYQRLNNLKVNAPFMLAPIENASTHLKDAFAGSIDNIIQAAKDKFPELKGILSKYAEEFKSMFSGSPAGSFPGGGILMTDLLKSEQGRAGFLENIESEQFGLFQIAMQETENFNNELYELGMTAKKVGLNVFKLNGHSIKMGEEFSEVQKIVEQTYVDLATMEMNAVDLGNAEVDAAEKTALLKSRLQEILKLGRLMPEDIPFVKNLMGLIDTFDVVENKFKRMHNTIARLAGSIGMLFTDLGNILGETFSKAVKPLIDFIRLLESVFRVLDNVSKIMKTVNAATEVSAALKQKETVATATNTVAKTVNTAVSEANAGATTKEAAAEVADATAKTVNTAATTTNTAAKVANAIGSAISWLVDTLGPLGIVLAVGAVAGIIALFSSGSKNAKNAAQMADGGIVPAGYPNDSYPAMLTSGETVVPPGKLPLFERGPVEIKLPEGEWRIKGRDLFYIVNEEARIAGNTF